MTEELDAKAKELIALVDRAISIATLKHDLLPQKSSEWRLEYYERLIRNLTSTRQWVVEGRESRVSRGTRNHGTGTGMGKWLGDWCDDEDVLRACDAVEDYIRYEY